MNRDGATSYAVALICILCTLGCRRALAAAARTPMHEYHPQRRHEHNETVAAALPLNLTGCGPLQLHANGPCFGVSKCSQGLCSPFARGGCPQERAELNISDLLLVHANDPTLSNRLRVLATLAVACKWGEGREQSDEPIVQGSAFTSRRSARLHGALDNARVRLAAARGTRAHQELGRTRGSSLLGATKVGRIALRGRRTQLALFAPEQGTAGNSAAGSCTRAALWALELD